ncbi:hypothetical protein BH23CHL7_BH23CHL7_23400 [soil metagenome]
MAGLFRFLAFVVLLVSLLVFVVVPAVASPLLTQMVRDMGLEADDLRVSIGSFDPALLGGRTSELRIVGTNVLLTPATVEHLDLTFGDVSFIERTFATVRGQLSGVALSTGGVTLRVSSVQVDGPAREARATGHFSAEESELLVRSAAERAGIRLDAVRFVAGGLRVNVGGLEAEVRVSVQGGALVLDTGDGPPILLLQPAPAEPWRLSEAYVTSTGIAVNGLIDATRLTQHLAGAP